MTISLALKKCIRLKKESYVLLCSMLMMVILLNESKRGALRKQKMEIYHTGLRTKFLIGFHK